VEAHIGGKQYILNGNSVAFIAPNIVHSFYYHSHCERIPAIKINASNLERLFSLFGFLNYYQYDYTTFPSVFPDFEHAEEFIEEISHITTLDEMLLFLLHCFSCLRKLADGHSTTPPILPSHDNDEITAIITWTQNNLDKKILLEDVASAFGYTKNYFCRKFKKKVGTSYTAFLTECRLSKARKLFHSGCSIKDVASQTGFDDLSYFTQVFRKHEGMTPKEFIQRFVTPSTNSSQKNLTDTKF